MNTALLRKIKQLVLAEPKRVDMEAWAYHCERRNGGPPCGTVGCIAGWAVILDQEGKTMAERYNKAVEHDFFATGKRLLKLTTGQAKRLFYAEFNFENNDYSFWPEDLVDAYDSARSPKAKARVVAQRIDRFIRTGGKE